MELKFIGRGAAFNPKEGNTSAYFIENKELFLIDCGETIFEKLIKILENIETINILITHTHSDHIGSLASLVMYAYYTLQKPLNIILPEKPKHKTNIENILKNMGCTKEMYNYISETKLNNKYKTFKKITYKETQHVSELNCYGIQFETEKGIIYYSGDTKEINNIKEIIKSKQKIDKIYIDTTSVDYPNNVHLYIGILEKEIKKELKKHIYCMHINNDECIKKIKKLGFNIVEI